MLKQPKREAYLKSVGGRYRYCFNWIGGGFNDIWARNLKEFRSELKRQFPSYVNKVDYSTLHKVTPTGSREWDRMGWMMCN